MKKRKSKRLNVSTHLGEQATPERVWHAGPDGIRVEQVSKADPRKRQKIISQHPIDRHLQRGEITKRQWEAAERLTSLHRRAGLAARTGSDWTRERLQRNTLWRYGRWAETWQVLRNGWS